MCVFVARDDCARAGSQDLGAIFGNFGEIKSASLVTDNNGDSKGYGFVKVRNRSGWGAGLSALGDLRGRPVQCLVYFRFHPRLSWLHAGSEHVTFSVKRAVEGLSRISRYVTSWSCFFFVENKPVFCFWAHPHWFSLVGCFVAVSCVVRPAPTHR